MRRCAFRKIVVALLATICCSGLAAQSVPPDQNAHPSAGIQNPREPLQYGRLPLSFEANQGQADERVKFLSRGQGYTLFLSATEALFALPRAQTEKAVTEVEGIGIKLLGANPQSQIVGADELSGKVSYFIGNDSSRWIRGVPTYAEARYQQIYPGIDLFFYGNERQLENDFVIAARGDPNQIRLQFKGGKGLRLSPEGDLVLKTSQGELRLLKPHVYQDFGGTRRYVSGHYVLHGARTVSFSMGGYDHAAPLVIDPILVYSTALNGANFAVGNGGGHGIAVDPAGNAYVTGYTDRSNFLPTPGAFTTANGLLFVTKINLSGSGVVYTAVLGGTGSDVSMAVALDAQDEPVIAGFTSSADFPTMNPIQATLSAGTHAFVTKLNATGSSVLYSTLLGGSGATGVGNGADVANAVATDANGAVYVTGYTNSVDFPTKNGVQSACPDLQLNGYCNVQGFVTKLDPTQSGTASIVYSTFLGGKFPTAGQGIAVDGSGNAYIAGSTNATDFATTPGAFQTTLVGGSDAFVSVLNPSGTGFVYSTFLGYGQGWGIAVDGQGNAYVTGATNAFGGSFPVTTGAFQTTLGGSVTANHAFVTKLNPSGSALVYSTFLGGSGTENTTTGNIAIDANANAYISGFTSSADFPTTANAIQAAFGGPPSDAFVTELNASGSGLIYSTYLGGTAGDQAYGLALDSARGIYVMGTTSSANFPTTPGAFEPTVNPGTGSVFVAKIGGPATHLAVSAPASVTAGTPFSVTVTALDASNNQVTNYTGTVNLSSTDAQAILPSNYTFTAADHGTHVFSAATLKTVGNQTITATDTASAAITGTSAPINVVVSLAATHFSVSAPASTTAGTSFNSAVTALNAASQTSTSYTGTVVFTSTDPLAVLAPTYTFTASDQGTHTFSATLNSTGNQKITATDTTNSAITGTSAPISVTSALPPPVQITDNESIHISDAEVLPHVFDAEAIHVADAAFVTPTISVTAPVAQFSAGGLGFGGQSGTQTITVSDIGQAPLTLASASISGSPQFSITQISCSGGATSLSAILPSGGVCILMITYAGSATPANDNAYLVFSDNAALSNLPTTPSGASYTQSVPLSGGGTNIGPPPPPPTAVSVVVNETAHVTDAVTVLPSVMISIPEPIRVGDAAVVLPSAMISVPESVRVIDVPATLPSAMVAVSESVHVQDQVAVPTLQTITVIPANSTIANDATQSFVAIGAFSDGSKQNLTALVTWSSSNLAIATMNGNTATAIGLGQTTITATLGSIAGSTLLTVRIPFLRISAAFSSIARSANGGYNVTISVTNTGDITANSVTPVLGILGSATTGASAPVTNLAPGATATLTVTFPSSAGTSGSTQPLLVLGLATGTNPNGTPAPPALWLLPPRQVTLP